MIVYKLTNKSNGKVYIGQTTKPLKSRLSGHVQATKTKRKTPIIEAIRKYGLEGFSATVLDTCKNLDELDEREKFYIKAFNSISPFGYNLREGGWRGIHNKQTIEKLRLQTLNQPRLIKEKRAIGIRRFWHINKNNYFTPARLEEKATYKKQYWEHLTDPERNNILKHLESANRLRRCGKLAVHQRLGSKVPEASSKFIGVMASARGWRIKVTVRLGFKNSKTVTRYAATEFRAAEIADMLALAFGLNIQLNFPEKRELTAILAKANTSIQRTKQRLLHF